MSLPPRLRMDLPAKLVSLFLATNALALTSTCTTTTCENQNQPHGINVGKSGESTSMEYKRASVNQKIMNRIFRRDLPTPRILTPKDPLFHSTQMKHGLTQRKADEQRLQSIQKQVIACVRANPNDRKCVEDNMQEVNQVLYGKGISMQAREEFLVKYGCAPYDTRILDAILSFNRGIMDIGAGNGQWARAISDRANELENKEQEAKKEHPNHRRQGSALDRVVAYDDQSAIPLNTEIYHKLTQPARDYFYIVQNMDGVDAVKLIKNRSRILLLVYPPPGPMAMGVVKNYVKFPQNDVVVFVGEGVGGANGNEELFDYWKSVDEDGYGWVLLQQMDVPIVQGGGKGFEKVFIFKRVKMVE